GGGVRPGGELHRVGCGLPGGCEEHGGMPCERRPLRRGRKLRRGERRLPGRWLPAGNGGVPRLGWRVRSGGDLHRDGCGVPGPCDVAESCDGVNDACPADAFQPATVECRASAGVCDPAESCTGTSAACPPDQKSTAVCRPAADTCDVAELCDGASNTCPPDAYPPATAECRPSTGPCDPAERCTGASPACPADVMAQDTAGDGVCGLIDDCPNNPDPAQLDSDGDGIGDACDPCNNIVPVFAIKQRVRIRNLNTPPGDDRLRFKGVITVPVTPPIDPATKGVRIMLEDATRVRVLDAIIPGGFDAASGTGWKTNP